jgi:hypothetical protein
MNHWRLQIADWLIGHWRLPIDPLAIGDWQLNATLKFSIGGLSNCRPADSQIAINTRKSTITKSEINNRQ